VIEPGPDRNRPADLVRAIEAVRGAAPTGPAPPPSVLVAHRPGQAIPDGAGLAEFWAYLVRRAPALAPHAGLALDPSALYAAARTRTAAEVARIPPGAVRYLRVHWQGERPDLADPVPWRSVFRLVRKNPGAVLVAPAVLDPGRLEAAILFCMVMLQERAFT